MIMTIIMIIRGEGHVNVYRPTGWRILLGYGMNRE